jgi:hypothetical protein
MLAYLRRHGWVIAVDSLALSIMTVLLAGGSDSIAFSLLLVGVPVLFGAVILWGPRA